MTTIKELEKKYNRFKLDNALIHMFDIMGIIGLILLFFGYWIGLIGLVVSAMGFGFSFGIRMRLIVLVLGERQ